jgi:hypothetical protein
MTIRVNKVEDTSPPITTIASGFCTSAPVWVVITSGSKPKAVVIAVMRTGLSLDKEPLITASLTERPCFLRYSKLEINISAFVKAIPKRAINPIEEGMHPPMLMEY